MLTGSHYLVGIALVNDGDGVGSDDLVKRHLHSRQQVQSLLHHDVLHQLHQHLRIGIADEVYPFGLQLLLDVGIVLDDAVVDDSQVLRLRVVRVRILRRGFAMCSPAGMGNTNGTAHILVATKLTQIIDLPFRLVDVQVAPAVNQCHTSRVVPTVFQSAQTFNQDGKSIFRSDVSYYSTHNR